MPASGRGVPVTVKRATRPVWDRGGTMPEFIRHATQGIVWMGLDKIEGWGHHDPQSVAGQPVLIRREVVQVYGPAPGTLRYERFLMELTYFADEPADHARARPLP